ncbi:MAG: chromosome segregation protein SMC, partial [Elusimicrobiaceae bacterium]|nr:chromosome segregation protein SMC [Elusimicrobiaceae bacterium]
NIEEIKNNISQMSSTKEELSSNTGKLRDRKLQLNEQLSAVKKELEQKNSALYEAKMLKANNELDLKGAEIEINNIKDSTKKRQDRAFESNEKITKLQEEKVSSEKSLNTERDKLAKSEVSENQLKEDLEKMRNEYEQKNTNLNETKTKHSRLEIKLHDLENDISNNKRRRTEIINNLQERWELSLEEAQNKFKDVGIDHDRIKMMRKRIENMGAINMTAPEEYDALTERNNFLISQMEDLNQAKQDLKQAISKINATTKESFKATFDVVRGHFKDIYQVLFTGGEADLVLTEPEDMLETGIDIVAQPPGKKLQNISALSGGEKALTALSLLFSFFRANPSPFCILDEADAPLDEANIERFVGLLKQFVSNTQFIVVTHNKRTMEVADILYGITMQESGVSKLMSVGLKEASEKFTGTEVPEKEKQETFV